MDKVTAPYNFVPLSNKVFFPDWAGRASQDWPFDDGICGTLEYELEALGPLFVRGEEKLVNGKPVQEFFKTPDGKAAIPGSSVRGLLRNVVQIASFGKFAPVNDHRYGIRDLHNPTLYGNHMTVLDPTARGPAALVPLVSAGWLTRIRDFDDTTSDDAIVAELRPCSFAKIEYAYLEQLRPGFRPGRKQSAPEKYDGWGAHPLDVTVQITEPRGAAARRAKGALGDFSIVTGTPGPRSGRLVFTGQPQEHDPNRIQRSGGGKPKHHDFVFLGELDRTVPVTKGRFREFEFIHSDRGQQGRTRSAPNEEWGYWQGRYERGERVPVFFLREGEQLRSFGLAMMFRLAYAHSVVERANANQRDREDPRLDLAETMFGRVTQRDGAPGSFSLKGRVSVGLARMVEGKELSSPVEAVLGAPKASFYPNYVEQASEPLAEPGAQPSRMNGKPRWRTFQDGDARLRGWKRYRPQDAMIRPPLPPKASDKVKTRFTPIDKGARFRGRIRIHNLRPVELGALLWALDLGGAPGAEHMIGMARSLGFGRARLRVTGADLRANDGSARDGELRARAVQQFERWAEQQAADAKVPGGWQGSAQLTLLVACAEPLPSGSTDGQHLSLDHVRDRNQFTMAKQQGMALGPARPWRAPAGSVTTEEPAPTARPTPGAAGSSTPSPARAAARVVAAPPPAPAELTVIADLKYEPGRGEWNGTATHDGKLLKLTAKGKDLPGLTPQQKDKRLARGVQCKVALVGGTNYKIVAVIPAADGG